MDARTLEALEGSIKKWEKIVAGDGEDRGSANCPLCHLFIEKNCQGCPVSAEVGFTECLDTPYQEFVRTSRHLSDGTRIPETPKARSAALEMLRFLESLRPGKEEKEPTLQDSVTSEDVKEAAQLLFGAFSWCRTKEGSEYWKAVYSRLRDIANGAEE